MKSYLALDHFTVMAPATDNRSVSLTWPIKWNILSKASCLFGTDRVNKRVTVKLARFVLPQELRDEWKTRQVQPTARSRLRFTVYVTHRVYPVSNEDNEFGSPRVKTRSPLSVRRYVSIH